MTPQGAVIRASVYTWGEPRGEAIACKLVELAQLGADVAVVHNGISEGVRGILDQGGVTWFDSRLDRDHDGVKDFYVHHKCLLIGQPQAETWRTYTGSHNWRTGSLRRGDEVLLRIEGKDTFDAYIANFDLLRRTR